MYLSAHSPLGKKITALAFAVLGGIFVVIGGIGSLRTYELVSHGLRTTGAVTEVIRSTGDDGSDRYTPVITYTCWAQEITEESSISSSVPYVVGQEVFVYCDPSNPERFIVDSFIEKYFWWFFLVIGIPFVFVGIGLFVYSIQRTRVRMRLKREWYPVEAAITFLRVVTERSSLNGGRTTRETEETEITVSFIHPLSGEVIETKTDRVPGDITSSVKIGDTLTAYTDPHDKTRFWVNVERFLV